ncbi:hypothetical protein DAI22_05g187700 [Oryza sativa Japonica Group]|nr:hypothetical protein DAI22_05g187700 [Oryza sativa Japonica Group]
MPPSDWCTRRRFLPSCSGEGGLTSFSLWFGKSPRWGGLQISASFGTDEFCGILGGIEQIHVQSSPSVFITFMAWSISEVIRYSHYALTTLKVCPPWLTYLRYTAFIPLYPIGVGPGEMWTMYQALPFVKERKLYSGFFGKFSMSYHSFLVAVLAVYPFLWMKLYLHVFKQRRSKLGKSGGAKKRA